MMVFPSPNDSIFFGRIVGAVKIEKGYLLCCSEHMDREVKARVNLPDALEGIVVSVGYDPQKGWTGQESLAGDSVVWAIVADPIRRKNVDKMLVGWG